MSTKDFGIKTLLPITERNGQPYVTLNNGNSMPMVGLGTWQSFSDVVRQSVRIAVNSGYRLIDTAFWYENEAAVGEELDCLFKEGVVKRDELFITTKLHPNYMGRDQVVALLKKQLADLKLDFVDLFLIHWPFCYVTDKDYSSDLLIDPKTGFAKPDYSKHYLETWKGMEDAVRLGLTKSIGVSNFNAHQLENVILRATIRPAVCQIESHPYLINKKLIDFCQIRNIAVTAFSTFANPGNGCVPTESDKYPKPMNDEGLKTIANKYPGKTPAQVMLRFQIQRGVAVIPRSLSVERQKQNINIFDFKLSQKDMATIEAMDKGLRVCPFTNFGNSWLRDYPFDEYRGVADAFA